jgi:hypothetical protein
MMLLLKVNERMTAGWFNGGHVNQIRAHRQGSGAFFFRQKICCVLRLREADLRRAAFPKLSFRRNLFQFWTAAPVLKRIPPE